MSDLEGGVVSIYDLIVPGGKQINPHAEAAEAVAHQEGAALGIDLPHSHEYATMSAYLFPHAATDRLMAIILLNNILFYVDDMFSSLRYSPTDRRNEALRTYRQCIRVFRGDNTPRAGDRLGAAFLRLRTVMLQMAPEAAMKRLPDSLERHLAATLTPRSSIATGRRMDMNHYIQVRKHDCGMGVVINLIEFSEGMSLDDTVWANPLVARCRDELILLGGLMNDIFSYDKEVREGQPFNLVCVLMEHAGCDENAALRRAISMVNEVSVKFLAHLKHPALVELVKTEPDLRHYLCGLHDQASASFHWQMDTNRYRSPQSPFPELRALLQREFE
ncbi:terpene synthase family protein [Streptomyces formicae]|uniref:Terpene synthase n=1 Tax=Streptomyces formicae TaxID=1616117 RepID=A0ABY3WN69_9ACTN|nr:hypothetical protein [Streptomyces formicae]UNM13125.1 hypothetical protein J4032_17945 [Streptomyces formicae]